MKRALALAYLSVGLAAAAACATTDDETLPLQQPSDPTPIPMADAGTDDAPVVDGSVPVVATCSKAGWCVTSLPDGDLTLKDIWPFESRAFAIAESQTLGVKVLEWDSASDKWSYIDDNSQNAYGYGKYAGKIWAPNENELYYGVAPAFIYHGKRTAPSAPWSWQKSQLEDNSRDTHPNHDHGVGKYSDSPAVPPAETVALGVWGTSAEDVYAWYANTIFHLERSDGGAPSWSTEYVADDTENLEDTFFIFGASGTSPSDIWFAGGRGRHDDTGTFACPLVIHKTPEGYRRVVDAVINPQDTWSHYGDTCHSKPGTTSFELTYPWYPEFSFPWTNGGWFTSVESAGPGAAVGILGGKHVGFVSTTGGDVARLNYVAIEVPRFDVPTFFNSIWIHETKMWMSGWGMVLHAENELESWRAGSWLVPPELEVDASTLHISTTVLNGAPHERPFYQVRGTSNTNLWAIGPRYALHKTTP